MIVTDSDELARRVRSLRIHGGARKYCSEEQGWNSRLDELQAAILRAKLCRLENWNAARRSNADAYDYALRGIPNVMPPRRSEFAEHVFHQYTIRVAQRDQVQGRLTDAGIASTVYYPTPIHLQPVYKSLGYRVGDLPETERAAAEVLSLPMYPELTAEQIELVTEAIKSTVSA
jgi:dTDP-4-amino-4,6-dideoxygalactose transaminase